MAEYKCDKKEEKWEAETRRWNSEVLLQPKEVVKSLQEPWNSNAHKHIDAVAANHHHHNNNNDDDNLVQKSTNGWRKFEKGTETACQSVEYVTFGTLTISSTKEMQTLLPVAGLLRV